MKNEQNKNARVPPGTQAKEDPQVMQQGQQEIEPDRHRMCQCCRETTPGDDYIKLLFSCHFCAHNCDDPNACTKHKCKCPGDCCAEHKAGARCEDTAVLLLAKLGEAVVEVCKACAVELVKKAVGA